MVSLIFIQFMGFIRVMVQLSLAMFELRLQTIMILSHFGLLAIFTAFMVMDQMNMGLYWEDMGLDLPELK